MKLSKESEKKRYSFFQRQEKGRGGRGGRRGRKEKEESGREEKVST
jgi:hypothetical protein